MDDLEDARAASPCNDRCTLDRASGLCLGCRRTLHEILTWREMGAAARRRVIARLAAGLIGGAG